MADPFGLPFQARQAGAPDGLTPAQMQAYVNAVAQYQAHSAQQQGGWVGGGINPGAAGGGGGARAAGMAAVSAMGSGAAGAGGVTAGPGVSGSSGSVWNDTEGRANELRGDPNINAAADFLRGTVSGANLPYGEPQLGAMRAQNAHGTAAAEAAQMSALRDSLGATGGSVYDPAYQAASREAMSTRQGRNLDYAGQLAAQAGSANFDARTRAASSLASVTSAQNAQINALLGQGAGYRAMESQPTNYRPLATSQPAMAWQSYASPGMAPPPAPAPQSAQPQSSAPAQGGYDWASAWGAPPPSMAGPYDLGGNQVGADSGRGPMESPPTAQPYAPAASGYGPAQTYGMDPSYAMKRAAVPQPATTPAKPMTTYTTRRTA